MEGLGGDINKSTENKSTEYKIDLDKNPILVFWEVTRACELKCIHCRAEAILSPLPGELTISEAKSLIDNLREFGNPLPILILTGGNPLTRKDIYDLIEYTTKSGITVSLSPSVTPLLNKEAITTIKGLGIKTISISLDGGTQKVHDSIRGIEGHFEQTLKAISDLVKEGIKVQINTTVMRYNVTELPAIVKIIKDYEVKIWEVFFLIKTGRGTKAEEITPPEYENVSHFLYDASHYGFIVRTVEAPFFRRIVIWRKNELIPKKYKPGRLYTELKENLKRLVGDPMFQPKSQTFGTRDGKGIIFVSYNGEVYPSGFLPFKVGDIREESIVDIYRNNGILRDIRGARFKGRCGICEFKDICGGSRARAYAKYQDLFEEDPACLYSPE